MKSVSFFLALILTMLLVGACSSPPPPAPPPEPPPPAAPLTPPPALEEFTANMLEELNQPPPPPPDPFVRHSSGAILDDSIEYIVQPGDTLSGIARRFYQDGSFYPLILMASSDVISDPDRLEVGMVLTIPVLGVNLDDTTARKNIWDFLLDMAIIEDQRGRPDTADLLRRHTE